jgi:multimeric flavodoxin WrbA
VKKICILDGRNNPQENFNRDVAQLISSKPAHVQVERFILNDLNISYCVGCWDCWLKTPGICRLRDEHAIVLESVIKAGDVIFVSEESVGFINATLKKTMDRLIPTVLPYIRIHYKESHHYPRYEKSANMHVVLIKKDSTTKDDINLVKDYFHRVSLNFNSEVKSFTLYEKEGDINYELFNV